jgi:alpha-1,3-rhamnosyl/mannosyltransferase
VEGEKAFASRVLSRADGVIADSENTRRDAVRILRLSPNRIRVIHLGIPSQYFSVPQQAVATATGRFGLRRPYFLGVGTIEPRKNLDTLLAAWGQLRAEVRDRYDLVIVGMPGWQSGATMARLHEAAKGNSGIRYLGYVAERFLPGLTAGATALVYPSLYEGFGLPAAQAMAAGCPVITSNVSSLPEVTGGAALLIDPLSSSELSAAITKVGESPELAARLRERGLERASRFTWEAAAVASLQYFSDIA